MKQFFERIWDEVEPIALHACGYLFLVLLAFVLGVIIYFLDCYAPGNKDIFKDMEKIDEAFYKLSLYMFIVFTILESFKKFVIRFFGLNS